MAKREDKQSKGRREPLADFIANQASVLSRQVAAPGGKVRRHAEHPPKADKAAKTRPANPPPAPPAAPPEKKSI